MHRSRLLSIVIDCDDLEAGVVFWTAALGAGVRKRSHPYVDLDADPGGLQVVLQQVPEPKRVKSRVHLDFVTDDLEAEVERLEGLGARRRTFVNDWWVMEDPCGNEFCVLPHWHEDYAATARTWQP